MSPEQLKNFLEYRDYINKTGDAYPRIFKTLSEKIDKASHFRYLLYLLMGTEVIKNKLRGLIILDDYISELRWYIETNGNHQIKKINEYTSKSYGQTLWEFSMRYNLEKNDNIFYKKLSSLNDMRNVLAHDAVLKYEGNIELADKEIKPYVLTQILDEVQNKLTEMLNERRKIQKKVVEEISERGLR